MNTTAIIDAVGLVHDRKVGVPDDFDLPGLGYPDGWQAIDGEGGAIGDTWDGTQWIKPPAPPDPVPEQITRAQGKSALIQADLMPGVLAFIASIADPKDRALAEVLMNDEDVWRRDNPFLNAAAASLGLTSAQIDDLFRQAAA